MPPATLDAFRDHGKPRDSLEENVDDARRVLEELERSGVSLDAITEELVKDGVKQFADAADKLYGAVAHKRATVLGPAIDRQQLSLGDGLGKAVGQEHRGMARVGKDPQAVAARQIGLDRHRRGQMARLARQRRRRPTSPTMRTMRSRVKGQKFSDAVVLGMGGSSLGPEVLAETFGKKSGLPEVARAGFHRPGTGPGDGGQDRHRQHRVHRVEQVRRHHRAERDEGLFPRARRAGGRAEGKTGHRFIAVTDPGSSLEKAAKS